MPDGTKPKALSREQKIGFFLLLIFAMLVIGLGILHIRNTMYGPLSLNKKIPPLAKSAINDINALRFRDTDKEGLSDFDELYVYKTSPYLEDTDSDGINDKEEITRGTNPLCHTGKKCGGTASESVIFSKSTSTIIKEPAPLDVGSTEDLNKVLSNPKQLRELLATTGMDQKLLDKVSDKDLIEMAKTVFNTMMTSSTLPVKTPTSS